MISAVVESGIREMVRMGTSLAYKETHLLIFSAPEEGRF
jgi:hypothetical protein